MQPFSRAKGKKTTLNERENQAIHHPRFGARPREPSYHRNAADEGPPKGGNSAVQPVFGLAGSRLGKAKQKTVELKERPLVPLPEKRLRGEQLYVVDMRKY